MKAKIYGASLLAVLVLCLCTIVWLRFSYTAQEEGTGEAQAGQEQGDGSASPAETGQSAVATPDSQISFTALDDGSLSERTMDEYLIGVMAGEMPATFDIEALKAQAVAARTYILYKTMHETPAHPDAAVCDDPTCCKAQLTDAEMQENWGEEYEQYRAKLVQATEATNGQYLVYDGEPIQAVFHSSSDGMTESSEELWSAEPYLVCVATPESEQDVPNFVSTVTSSVEGFSEAVLALYPQADLSGTPDTWVGQAVYSESGRVSSLQIGGVDIEANELRSMFGLRSTSFTLEYTDGQFVFTVRGFGHGVGMSQYGANVLASQGLDYREILEHYYPGTELVSP